MTLNKKERHVQLKMIPMHKSSELDIHAFVLENLIIFICGSKLNTFQTKQVTHIFHIIHQSKIIPL